MFLSINKQMELIQSMNFLKTSKTRQKNIQSIIEKISFPSNLDINIEYQ